MSALVECEQRKTVEMLDNKVPEPALRRQTVQQDDRRRSAAGPTRCGEPDFAAGQVDIHSAKRRWCHAERGHGGDLD